MRVEWRPRAERRLDKIHEFISKDSIDAADFVQEAILAAAATLPDHPLVYRQGRVPNTREMVVLPNYMIVYRVKRDRIQIVNVLHARQRYP
ncbi:translation repressor RelE [Caballeronia temeraria]|uniref:Translation repressor RelE n=1 Tax=Caballeronia temeraria TaxID=1777137 RepID=A0A158DBZ8_9BURK|nr:type II toxin-antitoxin system RelE/ParE family toxin [Caballeronia temeraria]SAK92078.1 translation repressor RelE [Caballeronia temeraria]